MISAALAADPGVARSGRSLTREPSGRWLAGASPGTSGDVRSLTSSRAPRARLAMAADAGGATASDSCCGQLDRCGTFLESAILGGRVAAG